MALAFGLLPANISLLPSEFTLHIPDQNINRLQSLISTANLAPKTWYEQHTDDGSYGVSRDWLIEAKDLWIGDFDWRDQERKINSYPNYKINLTDSEGGDIDLHFAALFSQKDDAVPIIFLHGWPGSFLEFLPFMDLVSEKYTPDNLPYHVIVPSIPSYGLSSDLSADVQTTFPIVGRVMNSLMTSLGFDSYVAQAGDFGSLVAQQMCYDHAECKAFHLNFLMLNSTQAGSTSNLPLAEKEHVERATNFSATGIAYMFQHGTRPSTTGLVMSTSPVALLAWVGEKFLEWVDKRKPFKLDTILSMVSFYWFTETMPRGLWPYGSIGHRIGVASPAIPFPFTKPFGYSSFPYELRAIPLSWAENLFPNLVFYKSHENGGHFAAFEQPQDFLQDVEEFLSKVEGL